MDGDWTELFDTMSLYAAEYIWIVDAVLLLAVLLPYIVWRYGSLISFRKLLPDFLPLVVLFGLVLLVFLNFYSIAHHYGNSHLKYGEFSHFFNVVSQQAEWTSRAEQPNEAGLNSFVAAEPQGPRTENDERAFFIACVTSIVGNILLGGIVVSLLVNIVETIGRNMRSGFMPPRLQCGYVAVLGYRAGMTESLLQFLHATLDEKRRIILLTEKEIPRLKLALRAELPEDIWKRLHLVHGGWCEEEDLRLLKLWRSRHIYLMGEDGEKNHDARRLKTLAVIQQLLSDKPWCWRWRFRPVCHILWEESDLFNMMFVSDIAKYFSDKHRNRQYEICVYDLYEMLAGKVLVAEAWKYAQVSPICPPPLDRVFFLRESEKRVHFIIIGMSRFGRALLRAAILNAHYPNFQRDPSRHTLISVIDANAQEVMCQLRNQYSCFYDEVRYEYRTLEGDAPQSHNSTNNLLDLEIHFIQARVESEKTRQFLCECLQVNTDVVSVAVCFSDSSLSLKTALHFPRAFRKSATPVYVYQESRENFLRNHIDSRSCVKSPGRHEKDCYRRYYEKYRKMSDAYAHLHPVGCIETLFTNQVSDNPLPKLFHRIYSCTQELFEKKEAHPWEARRGVKAVLFFFPDVCAHAFKRVRRWLRTRLYRGGLGLEALKALCGKADEVSEIVKACPPETLQSILENRDNSPKKFDDIWERFFSKWIDLNRPGKVEDEDLEKLPLLLQWSNRYVAEAQASRFRQFPAPEGNGERERLQSVLAWLPDLMEVEHQRWMAERLLNEESLGERHECIKYLNDIKDDKKYNDFFLCLATYLVAERKKRSKR